VNAHLGEEKEEGGGGRRGERREGKVREKWNGFVVVSTWWTDD
jgi:hypothetical protein